MVCPPSAWGTHLVHLTGSAAHNVALRGRALDRGLSLSEKGFKEIETGKLLLAAEEEEVYARLDLAWIPPELREDDGEIQAAEAGELPELVRQTEREPLRIAWPSLLPRQGGRLPADRAAPITFAGCGACDAAFHGLVCGGGAAAGR